MSECEKCTENRQLRHPESGTLNSVKTGYRRSSSATTTRNWLINVAVFFLVFVVRSAVGIQWLALSKASSLASIGGSPTCEELSGALVGKQVKICKTHPGFMTTVRSGAVAAIDECKYQFKSRRWNCSSLEELQDQQLSMFSKVTGQKKKTDHSDTEVRDVPAEEYEVLAKEVNRLASTYGPDSSSVTEIRGRNSVHDADGKKKTKGNETLPTWSIPNNEMLADKPLKKSVKNNPARKTRSFLPYPVVPPGTREAAFVHAISSAGVAHALTRACSSGELADCGCDRTIRGISPDGFQWSGCSDNVQFGTSFSKSFVDAREHRASTSKNKNPDQMWRALMNLHNNEAGRKIIEKSMRIECKCHGVSGSCEMKTCWRAMPSFREIGELLKDKFDGATEVEPRTKGPGRKLLVPRSVSYKPHTDSDLIYLERSPDYCEYDIRTGSLGTHGRPCNKSSKAIDGCDLLCCNRGYRISLERRTERCMCKFQWCCHVQCKTCTRDVEVHTCL